MAAIRSERFLPPSSLIILKPHPSSHGQVVKLSAIDQIAPRDYMSICLFFRTSSSTIKDRIFSVLHQAVSRTVGDIPELACCVQQRANNSREEVELLFDAERGVELHCKDYDSPELRDLWQCGTFEELEQEHFPLSKMPRNLVFGTCGKLEGGVKLPSLILQANFIPGGVILGGCLHVSLSMFGTGVLLDSASIKVTRGITNEFIARCRRWSVQLYVVVFYRRPL